MNVIKRLIGGGNKKKHIKDLEDAAAKAAMAENDYEREHCEVDFDKQFEQAARRSTSTSIPPAYDYRGSPTRKSKSPSPFGQHTQLIIQQPQQQQQLAKPQPCKKSSLGTPSSHRKCSEPTPRPTIAKAKSMHQKSPLADSQQGQPAAAERDKVKRNLTDSQKRKAKDIVESIDWIQPAAPAICYASSTVQPQVVQSQMICPQIHICEALPIARPGKAMAIIPQGKSSRIPQPLAASGKVISANRKP